jgi:NAD(P)-dependent dehydrogenase (short-subunit alcohol dehydrogenase family)
MRRMRDLGGKVALVTGAGSGIGRATARALASRGMRVVICDRDEAGLAEVARELGSQLALAARLDVTDRDEMRALAHRVHALTPALDVLVNNAGVAQAGRMIDTPLADWDAVLGVNLFGVVHGCHFFVPNMVKRAQGGHVVNVASMVALVALPGTIAYTTSKFAVLGLSEALRAELAPHRIGVSVICPGITRTRISKSMHYAPALAEHRGVLDRFGSSFGHDPEGVARAIVRAIRQNRGTVPVSLEARALGLLKRASPRAAGLLGSAIARLAPGSVP